MNREQITKLLEGADPDAIKEVVDYFEQQFKEIAENLDIQSVDQLSYVKDVHELAVNISADLY